MADDSTTNDARARQELPDRSLALEALDRLVGTWEMSGDARGTNTYEWMEGGHFLVQRFDFEYGGRRIKGVEYIGHERPLGAEPSEDVRSRVYSTTGDTLDYVYELEGDTLTIWFGERGSPSFYRGTLSEDGDTLTGGWRWPGGGYEANGTRVG